MIPLLTPEQLRSVKGEMTEEEREVVEQAVNEAPGRLRHLIAPEVKRMLSEGEGEKINWLTVLKYLTAEELKEIMLTLTEEQREAIEQKLRDAVVEAHADLGRWDREYAKVRPQLEANPEWTVKDAVEHLRADGNRLSASMEEILMSENPEQPLRDIVARIVASRQDGLRMSPDWVATEAMRELDPEKQVQKSAPLIWRACHLELRRIACEASWD